MLIEHTLKRFAFKPGDPDGSFVLLGTTNYHFAPVNAADKSSAQVADVADESHQRLLLNQKPTVFVPYGGAAPKLEVKAPATKVKAAPATPAGSGHPDEIQVGLDAPKVKLQVVIAKVIETLGCTVEEWNAKPEAARFQAVEELISLERAAEAEEKRKLAELAGDGAGSADAKPGDEASTGTGKLVDMSDAKLKKLAKGYGVAADGLSREELIAAVRPFAPAQAQ